MKRIAMFAGSITLGMASLLGPTIGLTPFPTMRAALTPGKRRHAGGGKRRIGRSKYMPHIGAKEQERAKRLYESLFVNERFVSVAQFMHPALPPEMCHPRATPTLCQMSKRQYEMRAQAQQDARYG